ncbi:MAG TPA: hypothetical protein PKJ37_01215 [Acidobacteriota bacterium]|nr:hypothetical protein [Acidobacteriota bacterium]HNT16499.1 hypothetical protein [Acidobacteriota bacterium]
MKRALFFTIFLFFLSWFQTSAASICYSDKYYPAVVKLESTPNGFIAYLGGKFRIVKKKDTCTFPSYTSTYPSVIYEKHMGWKISEKSIVCDSDCDCIDRDKPPNTEAKKIPPIKMSNEEAIKYFPDLAKRDDWEIEQCFAATYADGDLIWFGIEFYDGEGTTGIGGFGKYDVKTGKMEIVRPKLTIHSSIGPIIYDGRSLWFGTYYSFECIGTPPAEGLVKYEWKTGKIQSYEGTDDGPCGFLIRDMLRTGRYLWVATDMGLSRWDYRKQKWDHFVPTPDEATPFRSTTCQAVYAELLNTLPKEYDPKECNNFSSYYEQLTKELEKFYPKFLRDYLLSKPPKEWIGSDLSFLASGSKDFAQLNKEVLSRREISSDDHCIIKGFKEKKCIDPGWRDYLIKVALADKGFDNKNSAFGSLCQFEGDEKVGQLGLDFLERQQPGKTGCMNFDLALSMLTRNFDKRSVPILFKLLERFRSDNTKIFLISRELDWITGNKINGGLKFNCFLDDKIPESYSPEKAYSDWLKWWEIHKKEYSDHQDQKEQ